MPTFTVFVHVRGQLEWQCHRAESGRWIGVCDPLKLTVQGETYAELMEDIGNAIDAMLRDLASTNEIHEFLREHGWQASVPIPMDREVRFDVPFVPVPIPALLAASNGPPRNVYQ
jgi:predicted RNase H-like HicB family nuclease